MTTITLGRARLVLLSLLTLVLVAGGVRPASADVTRSDLPRAAQVARIFPYLEGGSLALDRGEALEVHAADCVTYARSFRASSVRFGAYLTSDGDVPYFKGLEDPTFFVYEFASPARARAGFAKVADYAERCAGRHGAGGTRITLTAVDVPRLGQRQLAYRTSSRFRGGAPARNLEVYVLKGNRIERSWIQRDAKAISADHAIRMAHLLATTAR